MTDERVYEICCDRLDCDSDIPAGQVIQLRFRQSVAGLAHPDTYFIPAIVTTEITH